MAVTDLQDDIAAASDSIRRVIDECVLTPIEGLRPAGEDIRVLKLWVDLRAGRPKDEEISGDHAWQPANPVKTSWAGYRDMVEQALCTRSKDLELGIFLMEASTRVFGFAGVRDGLWVLGGLIRNFFDQGLFPRPEEDDLEAQYGKLHWLNEKLTDVVREIELTLRPAPGDNYSLNYRDESRRPDGMISAAEFEAAAAAGRTEDYEELLSLVKASRAELALLAQIATRTYGEGTLSFTLIDEALTECEVAVQSVLRKRQPMTTGEGASAPDVPELQPYLPVQTNALAGSDSWAECERLARSGSVDRALSTMAVLAAAEPNGRIRFQRKLLLADLCLQTNRKKLGTSILQELNEIIEMHKLETWETSEIVGGVWARLVKCYRDRAAGTADESREGDFYLKLSRLDPWQALACGEPTRRD